MLDSLSVIVITAGRPEILRKSLTSFAQLADPGLTWELIVIDNTPNDATRQVVEAFADRLPIVYQAEPQPGSCTARNAGIRHSRYPFLIFVDDDVTVSEGWLRAYVAAVNAHPEASYFGGTTELDLSACTLPGWMVDEHGQMYAWLRGQFGEFTLPQMARIGLDTPESPTWLFYGANMAFYKRLFTQYGMFEPRLGIIGKRRFATEEPYLQKKLYKAGEKPWYIPDALAWHRIRQDELTLRNRWRWAIWRGRGAAMMDYLSGDAMPISLSRVASNLKLSIQSLPRLVSRHSVRRLQALSDLSMGWAYEFQMLTLVRDKARAQK